MNANEIRKLLDRYYDGQTTEAEEEELKRFFDGNGVPAEMAEEQAFFKRLQTPVPPVPEGLEQRISRQIDGWNTIEKTSSRRAPHRQSALDYRHRGMSAADFQHRILREQPHRRKGFRHSAGHLRQPRGRLCRDAARADEILKISEQRTG